MLALSHAFTLVSIIAFTFTHLHTHTQRLPLTVGDMLINFQKASKKKKANVLLHKKKKAFAKSFSPGKL